MHRQKSPVYSSLCLLATCIVLTGFFSACSGSGGGGQYSGNSNAMPPGTGGVSFQLVWQHPLSGSTAHKLTPAFNSCVDHAIGTIAATVSSGATTITSNSWPCSAHQGLILGVPAGSNYTVLVNGLSSGSTPTTTWSGQAVSITVATGQITNAGIIVMSYVGGDTTKPTVVIGPHSSPTGSTNVPITDRIDIAFSKPMAISTITSTNITLINSSDTSTVSGVVSYDNTINTAAFVSSATLTYNTQYVLQVMSCVTGSCITDTAGNQLLNSSYTNTFTTESAPTGTANAPANFTAKPGNGQVTLDWLASNGSTSYNVYYSTSSLVTTTSGTQLPGVQAPAVHLGLTNNTTYYYIVTAANGFGESLASVESSTTPTVPAGSPLPPASLAVNYNGGVSPYTVTWPTVNGISYNLYWSTRLIYPDHTAADNVIRNVTGGQYIHTGVTSGLTYCYIVTAMNSSGESADSMQVCGGPPGSPQIFWP
jgi:hypothetical protein